VHGDELEKEREREAVGGSRSVGRNVVRRNGGRQEAVHEINAENTSGKSHFSYLVLCVLHKASKTL